MIHCPLGRATSRARIATPPTQFTMMRIRSTTSAIGSAADDETGFDTDSPPDLSIINIIVYRPPVQENMLQPPRAAVLLEAVLVAEIGLLQACVLHQCEEPAF